jgi:8-oxo-dGTP pyrophosphatase MutT (NUDIX family)
VEISPSRLQEAERRYGRPREAFLRQELREWEMDLIERICGDSRFHDVTIFIRHEDALALVHKPSDSPGAFWAPGGGIDPDEALEECVRREAWEETGLDVEVERYLLRLNAVFWVGERARPWISHVFSASNAGKPPQPIDTREVEEAAWVPVERFRSDVVPILRASGWGRYEYRLHLADLVFQELGLDPLELVSE